MHHAVSMLTCRVFCPDSGGCGSSCNEYQQGDAVKTQCTSADTWPSHMCSLKVTADSDGGDTTGVESWVAGKLRERAASSPFACSPILWSFAVVCRRLCSSNASIGLSIILPTVCQIFKSCY